MYLLDTNVISELRKPRPHGAVVAWMRSVLDTELHLSAVSLGEIQAGIEMTRERDAVKAGEIEEWAENLAEAHTVIPMNGSIFRRWARLMHRVSDTYDLDAMIAATAMEHGLTVVTRNPKDFAIFPVDVLNPFGTVRNR